MPKLISSPTQVESAGNRPKVIEEYIGRINTDQHEISIARMRSPEGWTEPGQRPLFTEYTIVLNGVLRVEYEGGTMDVRAGQAIVSAPGEWVQYSTPQEGGAEYVAVCVPAFSPDTVKRDPG